KCLALVRSIPTCWPAYTLHGESTAPITSPDGPPLEFQSAETLNTEVYDHDTTTAYGGGGHVVDIPLASTRAQVDGVVAGLRSQRWTDAGTRVVMIDSGIYNGIANAFCSVRLVFEFLPYGDVRPSFSIRVFKGPVVGTLDTVLFFLDWGCYLFILAFIANDIFKISQIGPGPHFNSGFAYLNVALYTFVVPTLTRNPKPEALIPKPESRNPKHETRNTKHETRNTKPETMNPKPETRNHEPEPRNTKPESRNPKSKTRNPQP
ncbi:Polycystin cation channel-domain-containing protein, partial [Baffinella frigidus]